MGACQSSAAPKAVDSAASRSITKDSRPDGTQSSSTDNVSQHHLAEEGDHYDFDQKLRPPQTSHSHQHYPRKKVQSVGLQEMIKTRRTEGDLLNNVVTLESTIGRPIEVVYDGVHDGKLLGQGAGGDVMLVVHKTTGLPYACKCLKISRVKGDMEVLRREIVIMSQLDHPHIARLQEVYEDFTHIYLVQELCEGGELFDMLDELPGEHFSEPEAARLVAQMLAALRYLHSKGIIHRDLKLENFLFSSKKPGAALKMIDFGLSKHFKSGENLNEAVGTPYTVSPEIIKGSYDDKCDIWAIGVLTYLLLCGDPPFGGLDGPGQDLNAVRAKILKGAVDFEPKEIWSTISLKAKKFILNLLVMDPPRRPTAAGAQEHSWLLEFAPNQDHEARLDPKVVKALVSFKELSVVKRLLLEVLSYTLLPEQVNGLQAEFQKLDVDRSGEISLPAMKSILVSDIENPAEIENIVNAIKLGKSQSRIHWHEFLAGCISCCHVDERNIHLAFERLDRNHCGYITLDNVVDLMARDANQEVLRITWEEIVEEFKCRQARFTYDEFRGMMEKCLQET